MTIRLSQEDSARWEQGGWLSLEIQETILEDIDRQGITEVVAVTLSDGSIIFWVSGQEVI